MIPLVFDPSQLRATSVSRRFEAAYASEVTQSEPHTPDRVVTSNPDPVAEWAEIYQSTEVSSPTLRLPMADLLWTDTHERRFLDLAGKEATSGVSATEQIELEHLSALRRSLRNRRSGEELIVEYEQRELTRDVISALSRYVTFHKPTGNQAASET